MKEATDSRERVFTKWANAMLVASGSAPVFRDLVADLTTGVHLCLLVSALTRKKIEPRYPHAKVRDFADVV